MAESFTKMKIKLSREQELLEISHYVPPSPERGGRGEWLTKSLSVCEDHLKLGRDIGHDLIQEEREGLNCLILGLKVCETAEGLCMNGRLEEWTSEGAMQHLVKRDTTETSLR